jgi:hypothetical protein
VPLGPNLTTLDLPQLFERGFLDGRFVDAAVSIINRSLLDTDILVASTDIQWGLQQDKEWDMFDTSHDLSHLRALTAQILAEGKDRIKLPWNINNCHWAAYELTLSTNSICYADGFAAEGAQPRTDDIVRIRRWMDRMCAASPHRANVRPLAAVATQDDAYSCAIIMLDAILLRTGIDAPRWTEVEKDIRRIEWALRLCVMSGAYTHRDFGLEDGVLEFRLSDSQDSSSDDEELTYEMDSSDAPPMSSSPPHRSSSPLGWPSSPSPPSSPAPMQRAAKDGDQPVDVVVRASSNGDLAVRGTALARQKKDMRVLRGAPVAGTLLAFFPSLTRAQAEQQQRDEVARDRADLEERQETLAIHERQALLLRLEHARRLARDRQRCHRAKGKEDDEHVDDDPGPVSTSRLSLP